MLVALRRLQVGSAGEETHRFDARTGRIKTLQNGRVDRVNPRPRAPATRVRSTTRYTRKAKLRTRSKPKAAVRTTVKTKPKKRAQVRERISHA